MSLVRSERDGTVVHLTLERADKLNALSADLVEELLGHVEQAYADATDVVVFRGAGTSFSAGFDLSGLDSQTDGQLLHRFVRIETLLQRVHSAPFATLALAHGRVFGAGADLVCACSHRVAAPDTRFRLPGLGFGIVLGTRRLAARVGADCAREIQAGGRTINAEEADRIGLAATVEEDHWPAVLAAVVDQAQLTVPSSRGIFHRTLADAQSDPDRDLADLVRSAAEPGLVDRIRAYAARNAAARATPVSH
ncbi:enoyl-CoA hydratase/isomerase family protein [Rhodococcus koreensis]|uniref:enoyl-CoA hydratase/isomerase family protein n=1 Tax=Rhodococcus koreensis TaxID=99653 RepID=UPI00366F87B0